MHDARTLSIKVQHLRKVAEESLNERLFRAGWTGMNCQACCLIAYKQVFILIDYADFTSFGLKLASAFLQVKTNSLPFSWAEIRHGDNIAVNQCISSPDASLHPGSGNIRLNTAKDPVKPFAIFVWLNDVFNPVHGCFSAGVVSVRSRSTNVTGR